MGEWERQEERRRLELIVVDAALAMRRLKRYLETFDASGTVITEYYHAEKAVLKAAEELLVFLGEVPLE